LVAQTFLSVRSRKSKSQGSEVKRSRVFPENSQNLSGIQAASEFVLYSGLWIPHQVRNDRIFFSLCKGRCHSVTEGFQKVAQTFLSVRSRKSKSQGSEVKRSRVFPENSQNLSGIQAASEFVLYSGLWIPHQVRNDRIFFSLCKGRCHSVTEGFQKVAQIFLSVRSRKSKSQGSEVKRIHVIPENSKNLSGIQAARKFDLCFGWWIPHHVRND
jgi:hypothetical protein